MPLWTSLIPFYPKVDTINCSPVTHSVMLSTGHRLDQCSVQYTTLSAWIKLQYIHRITRIRVHDTGPRITPAKSTKHQQIPKTSRMNPRNFQNESVFTQRNDVFIENGSKVQCTCSGEKKNPSPLHPISKIPPLQVPHPCHGS